MIGVITRRGGPFATPDPRTWAPGSDDPEDFDMTDTAASAPAMGDLLKDAPKNWGKWGEDDELGCLNYLGSDQVLRGVQEIRSGEVFTLQALMGHSARRPGLPGPREHRPQQRSWTSRPGNPGRATPRRSPAACTTPTTRRRSSCRARRSTTRSVTSGTTARSGTATTPQSTVGGLSKASVLPIAERGVVGRGVLIDMARYRGKEWLDKGETFDHNDLLAAAEAQGVEIEPRDIMRDPHRLAEATSTRCARTSSTTASWSRA